MMYEITDKEYRQFCDLVYDSVGINLKKGKRELLKTRLAKRLRALDLSTFGQYYKHVTKEDPAELTNLLDAVSTNKTSFFREEHHFDFLAEAVLPELIEEKKRAREGTLRVWSAACSMGQEPYTLGITIDKFFKSAGVKGVGVKILGTDISTKVLETANKAVYPEAEIKDLPADIARNYFARGSGDTEGLVKVKRTIRDMVSIRRLNLVAERLPFSKKFDLIFCRNVMIYFDKETQGALVRRMSRHLRKGGYLFLGHAESLNGLDTDFEFVRPTIYRKSL